MRAMALRAPSVGSRLRYLGGVATNAFRQAMAHRASVWLNLANSFFFGLLRAAVLIAVYRQNGAVEVAGLSAQEVVTFVAVSQALIGPLSLWGSWDLANLIQTGQISSELTRPYDLYWAHLFRFLGRALFEVFFASVPLVLGFALLLGPLAVPGPLEALAFVLSILVAILLSFNWCFLLNGLCFWTTDSAGFGDVSYYAVMLLSGLLLPLRFFPDWLAAIARATPFASMVNLPAELFIGQLDADRVIPALLTQLAWLIGLSIAARGLLSVGLRRLHVQGG